MTEGHPAGDRAPARWVIALACACGSAWLYRWVIRLAPKMVSAEPTMAGEVLPWVKKLTHHSIQSIQHGMPGYGHLLAFMGCCAGLFFFYGVLLWLARGVRSGWFLLMAAGASAVFRVMLLCSPVMFSFDAYAYAFYGRLLGVYGVNAHATAPAAALKDPFLCSGLYWWGPSWYGPLWTVISAGVAWVGGGHIGLTLLLFRALTVIMALVDALLIWLILKRLRPDWAVFGTLLFLWNPLVVIENGLSGHNDVWMMALALLAVWLHLRGLRAWAFVALMASASLKVITLPLAPLYLLMVLRNCASWRERGWLAARALLGASVAVSIAMDAARMSPSGLLPHTAASADFYKNNYHELVFKGLRRLLGEKANTLNAPMNYRPWWVATSQRTVLHGDASNKASDLALLGTGTGLVALSAKDSEEWLRVYDPVHRQIGFVEWKHLYPIPAPANAEQDPVVRQLSVAPQDWPTVRTANAWIRYTTWTLFVLFGLLAAWHTRNIDQFITWGTACFLAGQLLVLTQTWPWYMVWSLCFGALKPASAVTRLAVMLSVGLSMFYSLLGCCNTRFEWAYDYRAVFTIVLPIAVFALMELADFLIHRGRKPLSNGAPIS